MHPHCRAFLAEYVWVRLCTWPKGSYWRVKSLPISHMIEVFFDLTSSPCTNETLLSADIFSLNLATALQARLFLSRVIKLLINATLSFVCKHCVFILIVVSKHFIFSNKVDLSQERSVVILRKRLRWNYLLLHIGVILIIIKYCFSSV